MAAANSRDSPISQFYIIVYCLLFIRAGITRTRWLTPRWTTMLFAVVISLLELFDYTVAVVAVDILYQMKHQETSRNIVPPIDIFIFATKSKSRLNPTVCLALTRLSSRKHIRSEVMWSLNFPHSQYCQYRSVVVSRPFRILSCGRYPLTILRISKNLKSSKIKLIR